MATTIGIGAQVYSNPVIGRIKGTPTDGGAIQQEGNTDNLLNEDGSADIILLEDYK